MQHAALIAPIMAAVTFAIMFLFGLPWLAGRRRLLGDRVDPPQAAAIAALRLIPFSRPALWGNPTTAR